MIASVCSGQRVLSCPAGGGEVLVLQSASWGAVPRGATCGRAAPGRLCASSFTFAYLARLCFRKSRCVVDYASASTYRALCADDGVELLIDFICVNGEWRH